jgi:hypothetical protein
MHPVITRTPTSLLDSCLRKYIMRTYLLCMLACSAAAFNVASRREVLKLAAVGFAPLAPLAPLPVYAKGKRSMELAASEAEEKVCASPALIMKELPCTVPSCTYG